MNLDLRSAAADDLPALVEIEHQSFAQPNWSARDFLRYETVLATVEGQVAGFVVWRDVFSPKDGERGEREILNLAVAPPFRRRGVAARLLQQVLQPEMDCFLEVRESNLIAQDLYRKLGFVPVGRREKYYQRPTETGIVMQMKWC